MNTGSTTNPTWHEVDFCIHSKDGRGPRGTMLMHHTSAGDPLLHSFSKNLVCDATYRLAESGDDNSGYLYLEIEVKTMMACVWIRAKAQDMDLLIIRGRGRARDALGPLGIWPWGITYGSILGWTTHLPPDLFTRGLLGFDQPYGNPAEVTERYGLGMVLVRETNRFSPAPSNLPAFPKFQAQRHRQKPTREKHRKEPERHTVGDRPDTRRHRDTDTAVQDSSRCTTYC